MFQTNSRLKRSSWRTALVTTGACAMLAVVAYPSAAPAQAAKPAATKASANTPALRGMTWDSIKGLPDWTTGMWTPGGRPPGQAAPQRGGGAPPAAGAPPAGGPPAGGPPPGATAAAGAPPAGGPPGGFARFGPPYKPEIAAKYAARRQRVAGTTAAGVADIPLSNSGFCIPSGVPEVLGQVSHEYAFKPGVVYMMMENSEIRRIFTDGRGHPPDDESNPSFQGNSIGHWEGDTLVVETSQIFPEAEIAFGQYVTEAMVIKERIHLFNKDLMQIDTVITDDNLFTKPWEYTRYFTREIREAVPYEACTLADRAKKVGDKLEDIDFTLDRPNPTDIVSSGTAPTETVTGVPKKAPAAAPAPAAPKKK